MRNPCPIHVALLLPLLITLVKASPSDDELPRKGFVSGGCVIADYNNAVREAAIWAAVTPPDTPTTIIENAQGMTSYKELWKKQVDAMPGTKMPPPRALLALKPFWPLCSRSASEHGYTFADFVRNVMQKLGIEQSPKPREPRRRAPRVPPEHVSEDEDEHTMASDDNRDENDKTTGSPKTSTIDNSARSEPEVLLEGPYKSIPVTKKKKHSLTFALTGVDAWIGMAPEEMDEALKTAMTWAKLHKYAPQRFVKKKARPLGWGLSFLDMWKIKLNTPYTRPSVVFKDHLFPFIPRYSYISKPQRKKAALYFYKRFSDYAGLNLTPETQKDYDNWLKSPHGKPVVNVMEDHQRELYENRKTYFEGIKRIIDESTEACKLWLTLPAYHPHREIFGDYQATNFESIRAVARYRHIRPHPRFCWAFIEKNRDYKRLPRHVKSWVAEQVFKRVIRETGIDRPDGKPAPAGSDNEAADARTLWADISMEYQPVKPAFAVKQGARLLDSEWTGGKASQNAIKKRKKLLAEATDAAAQSSGHSESPRQAPPSTKPASPTASTSSYEPMWNTLDDLPEASGLAAPLTPSPRQPPMASFNTVPSYPRTTSRLPSFESIRADWPTSPRTKLRQGPLDHPGQRLSQSPSSNLWQDSIHHSGQEQHTQTPMLRMGSTGLRDIMSRLNSLPEAGHQAAISIDSQSPSQSSPGVQHVHLVPSRSPSPPTNAYHPQISDQGQHSIPHVELHSPTFSSFGQPSLHDVSGLSEHADAYTDAVYQAQFDAHLQPPPQHHFRDPAALVPLPSQTAAANFHDLTPVSNIWQSHEFGDLHDVVGQVRSQHRDGHNYGTALLPHASNVHRSSASSSTSPRVPQVLNRLASHTFRPSPLQSMSDSNSPPLPTSHASIPHLFSVADADDLSQIYPDYANHSFDLSSITSDSHGTDMHQQPHWSTPALETWHAQGEHQALLDPSTPRGPVSPSRFDSMYHDLLQTLHSNSPQRTAPSPRQAASHAVQHNQPVYLQRGMEVPDYMSSLPDWYAHLHHHSAFKR